MRAPLKLAILFKELLARTLALFLLLKFGFVLPIWCPKLLSVSAERVPQHSNLVSRAYEAFGCKCCSSHSGHRTLITRANGPINYDGGKSSLFVENGEAVAAIG